MYLGKKVSIVLPVYNEKENIRAAIEEFARHPAVDEIVAVDNNSNDDSAEEIKKTNARYFLETKQGYGVALMRGMSEATGDLIITVEPDGTFQVSDLDCFLVYSQNYEVVFGTRTARNPVWRAYNSKANMGFALRIGNWAVAKILEYLFNGPSLTDVGCTYKLIHRHAYEKIRNQLRFQGSDFSPHFMMKAIRNGFTTVEIPVRYGERVGTSKITGKMERAIKLGFIMVGDIIIERIRAV